MEERNELINTYLRDLYACANKEMKEQDFITGAWFGHIADPKRPEQYIAVQFTGYSFEENVRMTARLYSPSDPTGMDVTFQQEEPYETFKRDRPITFMRHVRKMAEQFPAEANLNFFNPHALAEKHSITEFYDLLGKREKELKAFWTEGALASKQKEKKTESQNSAALRAPRM